MAPMAAMSHCREARGSAPGLRAADFSVVLPSAPAWARSAAVSFSMTEESVTASAGAWPMLRFAAAPTSPADFPARVTKSAAVLVTRAYPTSGLLDSTVPPAAVMAARASTSLVPTS